MQIELNQSNGQQKTQKICLKHFRGNPLVVNYYLGKQS